MCADACGCKHICCERSFLGSPPQQEHKEDGTEQNRERAHGRDNNLRYHLHVAGQRVCKAHTYMHMNNPVAASLFSSRLFLKQVMLKHSPQRVNIFLRNQIIFFFK